MKYLATLLVLMCLSTMAPAQLLVDDFTGLTLGANLAGQSGWVKGGSGPDATIGNATPLTYTAYMNGGGEYVVMPTPTSTSSKVYKTFASPVTNYSGTTFFYSFLLRLTTAGSSNTSNYFMSLGASGTSTSYGAKVFAQANGSGFSLGLSKTASAPVYGSTVLNLNTTYLVVVRYTFNAAGTASPQKYDDVAYLWVNPALTSEPSTSSAECTVPAGGTDTDFDGYGALSGGVGNILWHNRGTKNPEGAFDGIRVANGVTSADAWTNLVTNAPALTLASSSLDFGKLNIGKSATDTLTVTNTGYAALNISAVTSDVAAITVTPTSGSIAAQGSAKFAVKYTPTAAQLDSGSLAFVSNAASSPDTVMVKGIGKQPGFSVHPTSIDFGKVWKDSTVTDTLFVTNLSSTYGLVIDSVVSTDTLFNVTPTSADLGVSASDTFLVSFKPTTKGLKTGGIIFYHDSPGEQDTVSVSGLCIIKEPAFLATPDSIDFHGVLLGKSKVDSIKV
ncbi:MAG: choice-of-anchor D domain-containing protein, partial [Bacteroidetes bacterium]|nr:choice-of-anchor D domain-containing protein [Bacteroidota bacterium]